MINGKILLWINHERFWYRSVSICFTHSYWIMWELCMCLMANDILACEYRDYGRQLKVQQLN